MKKLARKQSKRVSTRQRVKTEKKIREYNRKVRKEKKKNPGKFAKSKKDPGVPNMCPFKEKVLQEVEESRRRKAEEKQARREKLKLMRKEAREKGIDLKRNGKPDFDPVAAAKKMKELEQTLKIERELKQRMTDRSAKEFYKQFLKMVDTADVIVQVLDSRDPTGSRCPEVENVILNASKKLVFVLNKSDLIPKDALTNWTKHLNEEFPTVVTSLKGVMDSIHRSKKKVVAMDKGKAPSTLGVSTLLSLIEGYHRKVVKEGETSKATKVAVVGICNVGKNSLMSAIKLSKGLEATSKLTNESVRTISEVMLDENLVLLDRAGKLLVAGDLTLPSVALQNFGKSWAAEEAVTPVRALLDLLPQEALMMHYKVAAFSDVQEFLNFVSASGAMRRVKKGSQPTAAMAAKQVLFDFIEGRLKFYTEPSNDGKANHVTKEVTDQHKKDFSMNQFEKVIKSDLDKLPSMPSSDSTMVKSMGFIAGVSKIGEDQPETPMDEGVEESSDDSDGDEEDDDDESEDEDSQEEDSDEEEVDSDEEMPIPHPAKRKAPANGRAVSKNGASGKSQKQTAQQKLQKMKEYQAKQIRAAKNGSINRAKKNVVSIVSKGDDYDFNNF